jgi:hypothetical protein
MIETLRVPNTPSNSRTTRSTSCSSTTCQRQLTGNVVSATVNNGTAITLTLAIANGTPHVNGSIEGATIVLGGASSPVSGTFTVNNYVYANATHAFVTLKEFLPTLPNGNTTYKLIFQMKDVDSFALFDAAVTAIDAPYFAELLVPSRRAPGQQDRRHPDRRTVVRTPTTTCCSTRFRKSSSRRTPSRRHRRVEVMGEDVFERADVRGTVEPRLHADRLGRNFSLPVGTCRRRRRRKFFIIFDQTTTQRARTHHQLLRHGRVPRQVHQQRRRDAGRLELQHRLHVPLRRNHVTTRSLVGTCQDTVTGLPVRTKTLMLGNTTAACPTRRLR